jgi:hypothetical protein
MINRTLLAFRHALLPIALVLIVQHGSAQTQSRSDDVEQLRQLVFDLERRVVVLEQQNQQLRSSLVSPANPDTATPPTRAGAETAAALVLAADELRVPGATSVVPAQAVAAAAPAPHRFPAHFPEEQP